MATVELAVGDTAPDFEEEVTDGSKVSLSGILSNGEKVILYFYPRDNTPGCTTQACDFRDSFGRFEGSGWRVIGVSTDSAKSHQKFIDKHELPFELIVDEEANLTRSMEHGGRRTCTARRTWGLSGPRLQSSQTGLSHGRDTELGQRATLNR